MLVVVDFGRCGWLWSWWQKERATLCGVPVCAVQKVSKHFSGFFSDSKVLIQTVESRKFRNLFRWIWRIIDRNDRNNYILLCAEAKLHYAHCVESMEAQWNLSNIHVNGRECVPLVSTVSATRSVNSIYTEQISKSQTDSQSKWDLNPSETSIRWGRWIPMNFAGCIRQWSMCHLHTCTQWSAV